MSDNPLFKYLLRYKLPPSEGGKKILIDNIGNPDFLLLNIYLVHLISRREKIQVYFIDDQTNRLNELYHSLNYTPIRKSRVLEFLGYLSGTIYYYVHRIFTPQQNSIGEFRIFGIMVGDMLLDTIMRFDSLLRYTHDYSYRNLKGWVKLSCIKFFREWLFFKRHSFDYATTSHKYYLYYGIQLRLGVAAGIKFFYFFVNSMFAIENKSDYEFSEYHMDEGDRARLDRIPKATLDEFLQKRFRGLHTKNSSEKPFLNKRYISKPDLVAELNLDENLPVCIIYLHAFGDANHYEAGMIYDTYFEWFTKTLEIVKDIPSVNWLVKTHPYNYLFEEGDIAEKMCGGTPVKIIPGDINAGALLEIADSIVTVRGTVGLEAACFDIRPILTGVSYYCYYDFTVNCKTGDQYREALNNISFKQEGAVSDKQKDIAARLLYWSSNLVSADSDVFTYYDHLLDEKEFMEECNKITQKLEQVGGIENDSLYRLFNDNLGLAKKITALNAVKFEEDHAIQVK